MLVAMSTMSIMLVAKYSFKIFALTLLLSTVILLVSLGFKCRLEIAELDFVFDFVYFQKALGLFFMFPLICFSFCFLLLDNLVIIITT